MISRDSRSIDAVFLGIGSIATQTVFIRFILSSQAGGELYAAIAIGGWIAWVGFGALIGNRIDAKRRWLFWMTSSVVKIPLAILLYIYPVFFTGILGPLKFLPMAIVGLALPGIMYGALFALLISPKTKASLIYRNEAIGSVIGGLLATGWVILGIGDFGLLFLISGIEISRSIGDGRTLAALGIGGIVIGITADGYLDRISSNIKWPGFETVRITHGFSGRWSLLGREEQLTVTHNGQQIATIPDRPTSEEALLWPFLFRPESKNLLLIGFEGIEVDKYLPSETKALSLYKDRRYLDLGLSDSSSYEIADPLSFLTDRKFDLVTVLLHGAGNLYDYRLETDIFFDRCAQFLSEDGILFVSAISDENYIGPELARYLSSLKNTLISRFNSVTSIPGPRVGFVCFNRESEPDIPTDPLRGFRRLGIDSPYFNLPLILNRLSSFRVSNFDASLNDDAPPNSILKPRSILSFLSWQGTVFGKSSRIFDIYKYPYVMIVFPLMILIPIVIAAAKRANYASVFSVSCFGFIGMAFEISILYLFQILFGIMHLHIGMIIAVFMAGMALGATLGPRIKPILLIPPIFFGVAAILICGSIISSEIGLIIAYFLLYISSLAVGFSTGGGYSVFANRHRNSRGAGATLYGADLYGALLAAFFVPGILISRGTIFLMASMVVVSVLISATLLYRKW